ncbi:MAG: hypothetical protein ABI770_07140 [Sphingomicrobium sp.]
MSAFKVRINTHTADTSAIILLADGVLIGVVSELLDECHGPERGKWVIETAFGNDVQSHGTTFPSASDAANWLSARVAGGMFKLDGEVPELR